MVEWWGPFPLYWIRQYTKFTFLGYFKSLNYINEFRPRKIYSIVWVFSHFFLAKDFVTITVNGDRETIESLSYRILEKKSKRHGFNSMGPRETIKLLKTKFSNRIKSKNSDLQCPQRSPELTYLDFVLWYHLKEVYANKPETPKHLKQSIWVEIEEILVLVMKNVQKRPYVWQRFDDDNLKDIHFTT